jgi:hypothetical protein
MAVTQLAHVVTAQWSLSIEFDTDDPDQLAPRFRKLQRDIRKQLFTALDAQGGKLTEWRLDPEAQAPDLSEWEPGA